MNTKNSLSILTTRICFPPQVTSPLPSPQSLLQKNQLSAAQQAQANRKSSLNSVIDKLKSEMNHSSMTPPAEREKKGEYQIKSSGTSSEGIKMTLITFNKTKKSDSKSPKHTGYKFFILFFYS